MVVVVVVAFVIVAVVKLDLEVESGLVVLIRNPLLPSQSLRACRPDAKSARRRPNLHCM